MAFAGKSLADGQVAAAWANLYAPSGVKGILKQVSFYNTSATPQTLEVRITRSGSTARVWKRVALTINESVELLTEGETIVLSTLDVLQAQTTTVNVIDFTITGAEE